MWKIIATDNQAREHISEKLIAEGIADREQGVVMCDALNSKYCTSDSSSWFYVLKEGNYQPYEFKP